MRIEIKHGDVVTIENGFSVFDGRNFIDGSNFYGILVDSGLDNENTVYFDTKEERDKVYNWLCRVLDVEIMD